MFFVVLHLDRSCLREAASQPTTWLYGTVSLQDRAERHYRLTALHPNSYALFCSSLDIVNVLQEPRILSLNEIKQPYLCERHVCETCASDAIAGFKYTARLLRLSKSETMHKECSPLVWSNARRRITQPVRHVRAVMLRAVDQNGRDGRVIISTHSAVTVPPNVPERVNQTASSRRNIANYLSTTRFQTPYQRAVAATPSQPL